VIRGEQGSGFDPPTARMPKCEKRFTNYERIDEIPYMVVKKTDGRAF